jgi:hypothetical protein
LSVPFFFRCIADFTDFDAERPYFAKVTSFKWTSAPPPRPRARTDLA